MQTISGMLEATKHVIYRKNISSEAKSDRHQLQTTHCDYDHTVLYVSNDKSFGVAKTIDSMFHVAKDTIYNKTKVVVGCHFGLQN